MNRRDLLRAGIATTAAALSTGVTLAEKGRDSVSEKIESLEERFDKLEHRHKKLVRAGAVAVALSTGIDLLLFF